MVLLDGGIIDLSVDAFVGDFFDDLFVSLAFRRLLFRRGLCFSSEVGVDLVAADPKESAVLPCSSRTN